MDTKYLLKKANTWYCRVSIPRALWPQYSGKGGKRHILKSLQTGDLKIAQRLRQAAVALIQQSLAAELQVMTNTQRLQENGVQTPGELIQATRIMVDAKEINPGEYTSWVWDLLMDRFGLEENGVPVFPPQWQPVVDAGARMVKGQPVCLASDAMRGYLAAKKHVRASTLKAKERRVQAFLDWMGGDVELSTITRADAIRYVTEVIDQRTAKNGSPLAIKTKKDEVGYLVNFFRWCQTMNHIAADPFENLAHEMLKETTRGTREQTSREMRPWTPDELHKLFKAIKGHTGNKVTDKALFPVTAIAAFTGMRLNEVCGLRVEDVTKTHFYVAEGKNKNSLRYIPVHKKIAPLVADLVKHAKGDYLIPGLKLGGDDKL
jgi:site-specific recombinase XerD